MFFRNIDMISPPITIYYKGDSSHSSIFSGILTIIVYSLSIGFGIQYAMRFLYHKNPKVYYYNRYVEDAGVFPVNSSQIFNFVQLLDTSHNIPEKVDFDSIRIIGIEETIDLYEENNNLTNYNHWIYGPCNNSTDTKGIEDLINFDLFTDSACIRYYYNKNDKKYYSTNDNNFKWPIILHGCSHPNRTFYGIILEKCRNDSLRSLITEKDCKTNQSISDYIKKTSVNFKILDNYADVLNYEKPFIKYFYSITSGIFEETYSTNHLNFNPITLITNDAIFVDNKKETLSYYFEQNEKITSSSKETGIYLAFYFWMQNKMQYYERQYSKFQDALSDIGGICSLIFTLSYIINFLVSKFIILSDTEGLLNEIESSKKFEQNIIKNNIYKNMIERRKTIVIDCPPKINLVINNNFKSQNSCNNDLIFNDDENNNKNEVEENKDNKENKDIRIYKKIKPQTKKRNNKVNILNFNENSQEDIINKERNSENKKIIKKDKNDISLSLNTIKKEYPLKIGFLDYIAYLFKSKKFKKAINCYKEFRRRIISEENLILSYLNICKILQFISLMKEEKKETKVKSGLEGVKKICRNNFKHKTINITRFDNSGKTMRTINKRKTISYK